MSRRLVMLAAGAVLLSPVTMRVPVAVAAPVGHLAVPDASRARALVDGVVKANPDILDVLMHVTPPGMMRNVVIAAHLRHAVGEISGEDDLGVMRSGKPLVEVQKDGVRIGVLVALHDRAGRSIGALGLMYPYRPGEDQRAVLMRSCKVRDTLARSIASSASLFE